MPAAITKRRRCPNCPAQFTPKYDFQKFCSDNCRKEFHKYGGAYPKLKAHVTKEITKRIKELSPADETRLSKIEAAIREIQESLERFAQAFDFKPKEKR